MENKKNENLNPELSDEALDQATGGQARFSLSPVKCSKCNYNELKTDEEKKRGICNHCFNLPSDRERY